MNKKNSSKQENVPQGALRLFALGGLHESGKNLWVFEAGEEILVVDAGIIFPGYEHPGIDFVFPEIKYLVNNAKKIQALILTNTHEAHAGAAVQLIQRAKIKKVVGSKLAIETAKIRMGEELAKDIEWQEFTTRTEVKVSGFNVTPYRITTPSAESYSMIVEHAGNKVFYSSSFKIDQTVHDEDQKSDLGGIMQQTIPDEDNFGEIDLYIGDSAGSEMEGYSGSEMEAAAKIKSILQNEKGRIVFNTCNLNTIRIQNLFRVAEETGRKIALLNKAAKQVYEAAIKAQVLAHDNETVISIRDIDNFKDEELLILTTAPEGNALEELVLLAEDNNLEFQLKAGDAVVNSADAPPGTVRVMAQISDKFFLKNVKIIGGRNAGIHVPTHAMSEELKFMFNVIRPNFFIPAFGETRQLVKHAKLAIESGFSAGAIFMIENGDIVELKDKEIEVVGKVETDEIMFNENQDFHIDEKILKDREVLSLEGVVVVTFALNKQKKVVAGPTFAANACTFSKNKEWRAFCLMNAQIVLDTINQLTADNPKASTDDYQNVVRDYMNKTIKRQIGKNPSIMVFANQI